MRQFPAVASRPWQSIRTRWSGRLHAMFQRDPFKILGRMAKEGGYDLDLTYITDRIIGTNYNIKILIILLNF